MKFLLSILTICCLFIFGETTTFANPQADNLTIKQQSIIPIASYTATGDLTNLKIALNNGLDNGLTVNETKEIMVHLYAYCGFPRALNGLTTLDQVLSQRQQQGITDTIGQDATPLSENTDMLQLGTQVQTQLSGAPVHIKSSDAIDYTLKAHLFGYLFSRDILSYPEREIATISALASMIGTQPQLSAHYRIGLNAGLTTNQLQNIIDILNQKVDKKIAQNAQLELNKISTK